tara:strand:+ start:3255 stop:4283 length:1029 start_codon:yes stop_codon:yes gene_type:complete
MRKVKIFFVPFLLVISWFYRIIIEIRNLLYDIGFYKTVNFEVPIISIGNISIGGTGKTPMVIYLSKLLKKHGINVGIISRGYGRKSKGIIIVHNENKLLVDAKIGGDEPYLIGQELKNTPIIVSNNRKEGIDRLLNQFKVDVILLDDGFQHRRVQRDIDIVLISAEDREESYELLPLGKLREPLRSLKRAHYIIYTKTKNYNNPKIHSRVNQLLHEEPINSIVNPILFKINNKKYHKTFIPKDNVYVFCGIANPFSFLQTINDFGIKIQNKSFFKDHQVYDKKTLDYLYNQITKNKCESVLTTEKDLVKIPDFFIKQFNFYIIKIEFLCSTNMMDMIKKILR